MSPPLPRPGRVVNNMVMTSNPLLQQPTPEWLDQHARELLEFGRASRHRLGFSHLDARGRPENQPLELYVTCRMVHSYVIGDQIGVEGSAELVEHGLLTLDTVFRDQDHGGWFEAISENGVEDDSKNAYPHSFVILAASSAVIAGFESGQKILDDALHVFEEHFWDEAAGRARESFTRDFGVSEPYRGMNSNMHTVEAFLAAADATGDGVWRERALRIAEAMVEQAEDEQWRIIEHFDGDWRPLREYNADDKANPFRPYGSTIGHWFEWARLLVNLDGGLGEAAPTWLLPAAVGLFDSGVLQGWDVDGAPGFIYTVDWEGDPVVRLRMHWVVAEAIGAAAALHHVLEEEQFVDWYCVWWDYAQEYTIDHQGGSWWHELSPENHVSGTVWPGKPDIYHALQSMFFARLPVAPVLVKALVEQN